MKRDEDAQGILDDLMDARSIETSLADVEGPVTFEDEADALSPDAQRNSPPWWE